MRRLLLATVPLAALAFALFLAGCTNSIEAGSNKPGATTEKTMGFVDENGEHKTRPLVDGGDPNNPLVEQQADQDPRTPVVEHGPMVKSWTELEQQLGTNQDYVSCMDRSVPMKWVTDVPTFKATEAGNFETRFIVVLNSTITADQAKQKLREAGAQNVDDLQVELRPNAAVVNTRKFKDGRPGCEEFGDKRPQIRLSLGKVR